MMNLQIKAVKGAFSDPFAKERLAHGSEFSKVVGLVLPRKFTSGKFFYPSVRAVRIPICPHLRGGLNRRNAFSRKKGGEPPCARGSNGSSPPTPWSQRGGWTESWTQGTQGVTSTAVAKAGEAASPDHPLPGEAAPTKHRRR